jgi:cytochrome c oxidase subunit II
VIFGPAETNPGTPPMSESPWSLLPAASANAEALDTLYIFFWVLCGISLVIAIGAQIYLMIKYRMPANGIHRKTSPITHNGALEFWWSAIPTVGFLVLFFWGEIDYMKQATPPSDAIDVRVTGQKWFWTVDYPAVPGAMLNNELVVPVGVPMRLTMTSTDVIHSFFVPVFRLKKDVVPGRYTVLWFEATKVGEYPLFCTEYCGDQHSGMIGKVLVVEAAEYEAILKERSKLEFDPTKGDVTQADFGRRIYDRKGCASCHSLDGKASTGPSWKGVYGRSEAIVGGPAITVDDNYIRESILEPNKKVVQGFAPQMPSFAGQLDDKQITALIEFMKEQK